MISKKTIYFLSPTLWYFRTHRYELIEIFKRKGYKVRVVSFENKSNIYKIIFSIKLLFLSLIKKIHKIHIITLKLYIQLPFLIFSNSKLSLSVNGLGKLKKKNNYILILIKLILLPLKLRLKLNLSSIIFQNNFDSKYLNFENYVNSFLIRGVGIYPNKYIENKINKKFITFCGRMIKEKGIEDFFFLIENLKINHKYIYKLILRLDESANSKYLAYVKKRSKTLNIDLIINAENVEYYLSQTKYFIFPSIYSEGLPKVVLEAAVARCIILSYPWIEHDVIFNSNELIIVKDKIELLNNFSFILKNKKRLKSYNLEQIEKKINLKFNKEKTLIKIAKNI